MVTICLFLTLLKMFQVIISELKRQISISFKRSDNPQEVYGLCGVLSIHCSLWPKQTINFHTMRYPEFSKLLTCLQGVVAFGTCFNMAIIIIL